jgi:hypothetical protein
MTKMWDPSLEPTRVEVLGPFTIRGDGSGRLRVRVDGEKFDWEMHAHVVTQFLRARESFMEAFDLDVRIVENMKVSEDEAIPYVQISPVFKRGPSGASTA